MSLEDDLCRVAGGGESKRIAHQDEKEKDDAGRQKEKTAEGKVERIVSHSLGGFKAYRTPGRGIERLGEERYALKSSVLSETNGFQLRQATGFPGRTFPCLDLNPSHEQQAEQQEKSGCHQAGQHTKTQPFDFYHT
jgi:hypothetical protein